jgi:predicted O-linked N-acetylglucosamine transferase (SPINDLY family)
MKAPSPQHLIRQAMQLQQQGDFAGAKNLYARVLKAAPENPDALHLYGLACHQQGDYTTAVKYIKQAVRLVPSQAVLRNNLGDALHKSGEIEAAVEQLHLALKLKSDYAGAHQNLSTVFFGTGQHDAALLHAREAVRLNPDKPEGWFNQGLILLDHVLLEDAAMSFRKALELRPGYFAAVTSLLYVLNLLPGALPKEVAAEHQEAVSTLYRHALVNIPVRKRNSRIRIAYVSGDFQAHAVNYFFEPLLEHQDSERFETWCYSDVIQADEVTLRLRKSAQHWHDIAGWPDDKVVKQIESDEIDVLVDLAGHTNHNRLGVFASRPAPCQLSYLGFPNTTGLQSMDYRVVDTFTAPEREATCGTEELLRLPQGFACFRPPAHAPEITPAPLMKNGYVSFGSLHKLEKLNDDVIKWWARILRENPDSRLLLARDQLDEWHQNRLRSIFLELEVADERLEMQQLSDPTQSFFSLFADIDIFLDTGPWSGHTLACCALWMGVPVVTHYGTSHAGRMVASVLHLLDMDELTGINEDSYVRIATELSRDHARLLAYRTTLRNRFQNSMLRDEIGFTRRFEKAIREVL